MIDSMVDWAWANYPLIDPVASIQKQTSMNPKAGRGKWSFDFVLKIVFFILSGACKGKAGFEGTAGLAGNVFLGAFPFDDLDAFPFLEPAFFFLEIFFSFFF